MSVEFIVERSRWYRGHKPGSQLKMRGQEKYCCVGFRCLVAGLSQEDIDGVADVNGLANKGNLPDWYVMNSSYDDETIRNIYHANDTSQLSDEQREVELKRLFASKGETIIFVG